MAWADDEKSVSSSAPIELYIFTSPTQTVRLTSYQFDHTYASNLYTATPMARSTAALQVATEHGGEFTVDLPATHALVQYYAAGIQPRELQVTVLRYQTVSAVAVMIGSGYVTGLSFRGRMASFRVPTTEDALEVGIPTISASKSCQHLLYDARCAVSRGGFEVSTTIATISADRKTITVAAMTGSPGSTEDNWARYGEVVHTSSTERRSVVSQTSGTTLLLSHRLPPNIFVSDAIKVYAGCDHTVLTCLQKFLNVANFGGLPNLPTSNPYYVDPRYV